MKTKLYSLFIVLAFLTNAPGTTAKTRKITGTIVAYYPLPCRRHICSVWIIVRLKDEKELQTRYVQMNVDYFPKSGLPYNGVPAELLDRAKQWHLQAERDSASDVPIPKYVRFVDIVTGEDKSEKYAIPGWVILAGAEGEQLPYGSVLPAFNVKYNGYKR